MKIFRLLVKKYFQSTLSISDARTFNRVIFRLFLFYARKQSRSWKTIEVRERKFSSTKALARTYAKKFPQARIPRRESPTRGSKIIFVTASRCAVSSRHLLVHLHSYLINANTESIAFAKVCLVPIKWKLQVLRCELEPDVVENLENIR